MALLWDTGIHLSTSSFSLCVVCVQGAREGGGCSAQHVGSSGTIAQRVETQQHAYRVPAACPQRSERAPQGVERATPAVHKAADAKALRRGGLAPLPLRVRVRVLMLVGVRMLVGVLVRAGGAVVVGVPVLAVGVLLLVLVAVAVGVMRVAAGSGNGGSSNGGEHFED